MISSPSNLFVTLLHDGMLDKQGKSVTTSLTLLDIHDIARSSRTFGVNRVFIQHSSPILRQLAGTLTDHWQSGFGSTYNPDRKEALSVLSVVPSLQEIEDSIRSTFPELVMVATSAKRGSDRLTYTALRTQLEENRERAYLIMLGTGWGMSDELLSKADLLLEPICGPSDYNHLSVRSACAIILDRLRST